MALTAIVLDGLRREALTVWRTPTALWALPAAMGRIGRGLRSCGPP